jgi:GxxExxY protein
VGRETPYLQALHHGGREDTGRVVSAFEASSLRYQLSKDGITFEHQRRLPVLYDGVQVDAGYRIDFLVEHCVIVELKAVEKLLLLHLAQVLTYLKLSGHRVALLINFNVPHLRDGIRRVMNGMDK